MSTRYGCLKKESKRTPSNGSWQNEQNKSAPPLLSVVPITHLFTIGKRARAGASVSSLLFQVSIGSLELNEQRTCSLLLFSVQVFVQRCIKLHFPYANGFIVSPSFVLFLVLGLLVAVLLLVVVLLFLLLPPSTLSCRVL